MEMGEHPCLVCKKSPGIPVPTTLEEPVNDQEAACKRRRVALDCCTSLTTAVAEIERKSKEDLAAFAVAEKVLRHDLVHDLTAEANRRRAAHNAAVKSAVKDMELRADSAQVYAAQITLTGSRFNQQSLEAYIDATVPVLDTHLDKSGLVKAIAKHVPTGGFSFGYKTSSGGLLVDNDTPVFFGSAASVLRYLLAQAPTRHILANIRQMMMTRHPNGVPALCVYDPVSDVLRRSYRYSRDMYKVEHKEEFTMDAFAARLLAFQEGVVYMKEHPAPLDIDTWCQDGPLFDQM